ncbi:MAG: hypothetical protein GY802_13930 [Gammaproteobacteria bacterium]|nr:hypothetical protein [Gammaproteobacteria bacterium]
MLGITSPPELSLKIDDLAVPVITIKPGFPAISFCVIAHLTGGSSLLLRLSTVLTLVKREIVLSM